MLARSLPVLLCAACAAAPPDAGPQDGTQGAPRERERAQVGLSFDVLEASDEHDVDSLTLEVRMPEGSFELQPMLGVTAADDTSLYYYGGLRWNLDLNAHLRVSPGIAVGFFDAGDFLDLGHELEFRSSLELSTRLGKRGRLALEVFHLSNASLSEHNPGTEGLVLRYLLAL